MTRKERLSDRTCKYINQGKGIFLKHKTNGSYLGQWTCIQGGIDMAHWTNWKGMAMEINDLEWAFGLAKLYNCKVMIRTHKKKK